MRACEEEIKWVHNLALQKKNLYLPSHYCSLAIATEQSRFLFFIAMKAFPLLAAFFLLSAAPAMSQTLEEQGEAYAKPNFEQSVFYKACTAQQHKSLGSWTLDLMRQDKSSVLRVDTNVEGMLDIVPDKDAVYDCSEKRYTMSHDQVKLEYAVYAWADRLRITFEGKTFEYNCIDGACDVHIKHLKRDYTISGYSETMRVDFTDDVVLHTPGNRETSEKLMVKKGSYFLLTTER